jgi:membrane protease YdiL (CAAX protease family)
MDRHERNHRVFPALRAWHTNTFGIPLFVFFGTGTLYAMMRWRSNSTATAALMHATYNAVIALAMIRA